MSKPHSLYAAAKELAIAADIPWTELKATYRALQEGPRGKKPWLPKNLGRKGPYAQPHYIARLLVAHCCSTGAETAREAIKWVRQLTPEGHKFQLNKKPTRNIVPPIENEFSRYLVAPNEAARLESVELHPDAYRIVFNTNASTVAWLSPKDTNDLPPAPEVVPRAATRTLITGQAFHHLSATVKWDSRPDKR
jgi:hypothetical protein